MADISKIKLPDGNTYNIKDANATDTKVTQTFTSTGNNYYLLMSGTPSDDNTRTEGARKSDCFRATVGDTDTDAVMHIGYFGVTLTGPKYMQDGYGTIRVTKTNSLTPTVYISGDAGDITAQGKVTCDSISANSVTLPHQYSETEQIVGYWIDNSPVYEITKYALSSTVNIAANSTSNVMSWTTPIQPISLKTYRYSPSGSSVFYTVWEHIAAQWNGNVNQLQFYNPASVQRTVNGFTMQYIKI